MASHLTGLERRPVTAMGEVSGMDNVNDGISARSSFTDERGTLRDSIGGVLANPLSVSCVDCSKSAKNSRQARPGVSSHLQCLHAVPAHACAVNNRLADPRAATLL